MTEVHSLATIISNCRNAGITRTSRIMAVRRVHLAGTPLWDAIANERTCA